MHTKRSVMKTFVADWKCDTCGAEVTASYLDLASIGCPVCSDCDELMGILIEEDENDTGYATAETE